MLRDEIAIAQRKYNFNDFDKHHQNENRFMWRIKKVGYLVFLTTIVGSF